MKLWLASMDFFIDIGADICFLMAKFQPRNTKAYIEEKVSQPTFWIGMR